ncbi:DUF4947 domain-containing protein [Streptococcus dentasini]
MMGRKRLFLLLCLLASCAVLAACSSKRQTSTDKSVSTSNSAQSINDGKIGGKKNFSSKRHPEDLPEDAGSAKTDKIYATDGSEIYYESYESGFSASTPEYKGYTNDNVKDILGEPSRTVTNRSDMSLILQKEEQERIVSLFKSDKISREEARAFYAAATDYSLDNLSHYYIYEYSDKNIILLFAKGSNKLSYMTPDPDYAYWR